MRSQRAKSEALEDDEWGLAIDGIALCCYLLMNRWFFTFVFYLWRLVCWYFDDALCLLR